MFNVNILFARMKVLKRVITSSTAMKEPQAGPELLNEVRAYLHKYCKLNSCPVEGLRCQPSQQAWLLDRTNVTSLPVRLQATLTSTWILSPE
jgi:hypothetical protein